MELLGASERDFGRSSDEFLFTDEVSVCGIQRVRVAAIEGMRIDYGNEGSVNTLS